MTDQAHSRFLNDVIGDSLTTDPKKFWRYVKSQRRESAGIATLKVGDRYYSTDTEKSDALNDQISSVFTRENSHQLPDKGPSPYDSIENLEIRESGILKQLKQLNTTKASGPDGIPGRMLHDYAEELSPIITHLFQQSYETDEIPQDWKKARVTSIYKSGDKTVDVLSGVPQGSVLGPTLFLAYINDICGEISSPIRLFADDCVVYRCIRSRCDQELLQKDLSTLTKWAETWDMAFNIKKCAHMTITL
ncbi:uncharacterized protein [Diadema setosum]|uniref:uncharacterized protein n=1 Tax=Diadema setosum TaxID=31175 RepID=UPI003B3BB37E